MGVSQKTITAHIQEWEAKLGPGYRKRWPSRLFRHEALENVVELLKAGQLLSRNDAQCLIKRDVAPDEIINANNLAHSYSRLYFRPKTPTQYRIEGIRRPEDIWNGKHAPVLYMLVFRAEKILTRGSTRFSRGNMQAANAEILNGDNAFGELDFRKIYHEGSYSQDEADIKVWRCAEVLCESPLIFDDCLEAIVCRSDAERRTLLYKLGNDRENWSPKIRTVTQPGYFNAEYAFVESVDLNSDALTVKFHSRRRLPFETWVEVEINPLDSLEGPVLFERKERDLRKRWNFLYKPAEGRYTAKIWIDDELAYESQLEYFEEPF